MDISRIERRIKKINSVLDVFKEDNRLTAIEKDLLLGYVRELYDIIKDSETDPAPTTKSEMTAPKEEKPIQPPVVEKKAEIPTPVAEVKPEPVVELKPEPVIEPKPEPVVEKKEDVVPVVTIKETPAPVAKPTASSKITDDLEAVFIEEEATDISGKLSKTKIDDISKVIGINEKLFTINELFGNNAKLFEATVKKLNEATSFDEAKNILIHEVALPMNWEKEGKLKQAQQFIKHVRRKFN